MLDILYMVSLPYDWIDSKSKGYKSFKWRRRFRFHFLTVLWVSNTFALTTVGHIQSGVAEACDLPIQFIYVMFAN